MDRADLRRLVERAGCKVTAWHPGSGAPLEFDCPSTWAKVRILDAAAWSDARYDARIRAVAVGIAKKAPDTSPATLAACVLRAVQRRVRYLGEGLDTFQSSWVTWSSGLGDCDDSARLVVALARALGIDASVTALAGRDGEAVHAVAQVIGRWADATLSARYGEHPLAALRRLRASGAPTRNYRLAAATSGRGDLGSANDDARATARAALDAAWDRVPGLPEKTAAALQMVQAVALGPEGSDGANCWTNRGAAPPCPGVCHNWAGLQLPGSPTTHDGSVPNCPSGSAPCTDHLRDGSEYGVCFMTYPDQASGAEAYLRRLILTHETAGVVGSGDADAMAAKMFSTHYFGGIEGSAADRIDSYAGAIASAAERIAGSLGESVLVTRGGGAGGVFDGVGASTWAIAAGGVFAAWAGWRWWKRRARR